jgi:hypothetical protein
MTVSGPRLLLKSLCSSCPPTPTAACALQLLSTGLSGMGNASHRLIRQKGRPNTGCCQRVEPPPWRARTRMQKCGMEYHALQTAIFRCTQLSVEDLNRPRSSAMDMVWLTGALGRVVQKPPQPACAHAHHELLCYDDSVSLPKEPLQNACCALMHTSNVQGQHHDPSS